MKTDDFSLDKTSGENAKVSIDKILNNKTTLRKKPKTPEDKRRAFFNIYITGTESIYSRSVLLEEDFALSLFGYDESFHNVIDALLSLLFSEKQKDIIDFYLYERFNEAGDLISLQDQAGHVITLEHPDQLWEYLKTIK